MAALERVISENNIDAARIVKLDESGISVELELKMNGNTKVYATRSQRPMPSCARLKNVSRNTIHGTAQANRDIAPPMFVFQ